MTHKEENDDEGTDGAKYKQQMQDAFDLLRPPNPCRLNPVEMEEIVVGLADIQANLQRLQLKFLQPLLTHTSENFKRYQESGGEGSLLG